MDRNNVPIPQPHQNWSQHARLLPYLEQRVLYNMINWNFGARWNGDTVYTDLTPPTGGSTDSIPQMTVLVTTIAAFLVPIGCQSRLLQHLPRGWREQAGGCQQLSVQYRPEPADHRRETGLSWKLNGPNYVASTWDKTVNDTTNMATFLDGTSNTVIFSEWIKGPAVPTGSAPNGLGEVYNLGENSNFYPTDYQFAQLCNTVPITSANQQWQWKGEWWGFGATMIYSHTQTPNRTSCVYHDINQDGRGTITMIAASSNHPGGVNVLFMDGSVRFVKSSVNYLTWYAIATPNCGEAISSDSY